MTLTRLGDVVTVKSGFAFKSADWLDVGVPVIKIANVKDGWVTLDGCSFVSEAVAHSARVFELTKGDVLISMTGHIGQVAKVRDEGRMLLNQRVGRFSIKNRDRIDDEYLFQWLRLPEVRAVFEAHAYGAAQPNISPSLIEQQAIPLPPLPIQQRIASILATYDDLIENNTRRIAILEEMARRIYEEWFVRFRFPGHEGVRMVETELGLVPEGWSVQGLYDVADLTYGFPFKSNLFKETGEGLGVIRIRDIRNDYTATRTTEYVDLKYRVTDGDILVGMDGAFHMGRWAGGVAWLNQRVVRFRPKSRIPRSWLFWVTEEPIKTLEATIVGTTVAHLSARDLKEMRLLVPSEAALEAAGSVLEPMSDLELTLKKKNAVLRVTRDLLLPKLISGELDVSVAPDPEAVAA